MEIKFGQDVVYFIWSLLSGVAGAFLYDFLRAFRNTVKMKKWAVTLTDIAALLISFILMSFEAYFVNNGKLRLYAVLSLIGGFAVYRIIVRDFVKNFICSVMEFLKKILLALFNVFAKPVKVVIRLIKKPFFAVLNITGKRNVSVKKSD